MKKLFLVVCLLIFSIPVYSQTPEKPKEILITLDSKFYNSASSVIVGFFKQAKINNYFLEEKLEKDPVLNFRFSNKTIKETIDLLSKIYSVDFETNDKKDFYFVKVREKRWSIL